MKSMRLVSEGQPLREMKIETPRVGSHSVLVKVDSAGVCHSDIHLISGSYDLGDGKKLSSTRGGAVLPLTPGHEIAGTVEELGSEAEAPERLKKGDHVVVYPWIGCGTCRKCLSGKENLCEGTPAFLGFSRDGGYAEGVLVPDARYLVKADGLDPSQSATLACSGLTAFSAVKRCGLRSDDLLLIIGAGGLGTAAVQIAKKVTGARIAVADIDDSKLQLATDLGADHVFNTAKLDAKNLVSEIRAANQGRGADAVADFVGRPERASLGIRALGHESRLVLVGLMGGSLNVPLPMLPLLGTQVVGNFTGAPADLLELVDLAKRGVIAPVVTETYRLEEANDALAKLQRGEVRGRAVLKP